jgi:hypothetical protein
MIDDGYCGAIGGMKIEQGKPDYSEKNLPHRHFVQHKSHMTRPGLPEWEASD